MKRVETWNESVAAFKRENGVLGMKDAVVPTTAQKPSSVTGVLHLLMFSKINNKVFVE